MIHDGSPIRTVTIPQWRSLLFCGLLMLSVLPGFTQTKLTLEECVKTALQNNLGIKSSEYQIQYFKELRKTSADIGKTSAVLMHGQYNSVYTDNNLTVLQTIPFPTAIASQFKLGKEQIIGAQQNVLVQQNSLIYEVRSVYYLLAYHEALSLLLQSQDSLYADLAHASDIRYKTGESTLLEKTSAETQWMEIRNQRRQNASDISIAEARLQALLKADQPIGAAERLTRRAAVAADDSLFQNNPELKLLKQQVNISRQFTRVEKNRILPDLMVGGFAQSLTGVQNINGTDTFFPSSKRFNGLQVGLSIPLWFRPQVARARAAAVQEDISRTNATHYGILLRGAFQQAMQEVEKSSSALGYYEGSALGNASLLITQASKAFRGGEIGYLEYLQALRQSISIKAGYLQALNQYNQSLVKLEFLSGSF